MESWDDDDFVPPPVAQANANTNKWEGEDEDDEVKDNWEDEDEEKDKDKDEKDENSSPAIQKPKKKPLSERLAEKERLKREELARRLKEEEEDEMSPEEKLRRQQESDLSFALDTTFGGYGGENVTIDGLSLPQTKEEFEGFTESLSKKLIPLSKNVEYPNFVESLVRNLCATMSSLDIKRIKNTLDNLYLEKQKIEKGEKSKKNKGKGKAKLKMEGDNQQLSAYVDYDEYQDFM